MSNLTNRIDELSTSQLEEVALYNPLRKEKVRAMEILGFRYFEGFGAPLDRAQGLLWYKRAAKSGSLNASNTLGDIFGIGRIVRRNDKLALKWWTLAAELGHAHAQASLGHVYAWGSHGVEKNAEAALRWNTLAADQGHAFAKARLSGEVQ